MGLINLDHMKALALRTKAYMSGHLATLAQEVVNSMEQMDEPFPQKRTQNRRKKLNKNTEIG